MIQVPTSNSARNGICWMLLTMLLFVSMDTTAKYLIRDYSVVQVSWARYLVHALLIAALLGRRLPSAIRTNRLPLQLLRSSLLLAITLVYFVALSFIPLADATAIMASSPLILIALSVPLLGERVGIHRWFSVGAGFCGALIIIRPGLGVMQLAALLPLLSAFFYALYQIITRKLSSTEAPLTTLFYTASVGTVVTTLAVPFFWTTPDVQGWLLMGLIGILGSTGHFAMIKAFEYAPATTIAPFGYTSLLWATAYGYAIFGEFPDTFTLAGAAIIAASGLYVLHRERLKAGEAL